MKKVYKHTIARQLIVFSLLISVLPAVLISLLLFVNMKEKAEADLSKSHLQIVSQYGKNIEEKLEHYQMGIQFVANNTSLIGELLNSEGNTYRRGRVVSEEVAKSLFFKESSEVRNCMVYSLDENNPIYGASASMISVAEKEPWYTKERLYENGWFTYYWPVGKVEIFSFVEPVFVQKEYGGDRIHIGSVKLDINLSRLMEPTSDRSYSVFVYNDENQLLYSSDKMYQEMIAAYLKDQQREDVEAFFSRYEKKYQRLDEFGMNILFLFEKSEFQEKTEEVLFLIVPALMVVLAFVLLSSYLYTKHFSSRIERLVKKFKTAETGDLNIYDPIEGNDEIADLDRRFSQMLAKLDALIQRNYVQKLEKRETQLRNLQLQINPHFLYNTLETISSLAAIQHMFDVCDMCQKLGEIFRYSLGRNYGEYVTVEQELHHTKNYVFIQKMRYGNRFEVFYNIEVDTKRHKLLRFILQPIVENAIVHGWGELTVSGTLEISVYEEHNCLFIKIEDDGVGIKQNRLEELTEYINNQEDLKDTKKSIGIRNVNQRIKLSCGDEYGITIESEVNMGSRFMIRLPLIN